jgi:hypothetical protein
VHLDSDALLRLGAALATQLPAVPTYDRSIHFRGSEADTIRYVLCLDAINFGSGSFPHLRKRGGCSGYGTVASRLADRFRENGPWTTQELRALRADRLRRILHQAAGDPALDALMAQFAASLQALGRWLQEDCEDSFERLIATANGSAVDLVRILSTCPAFDDRWAYRGRTVPLLKRAQIAAWDLYLAFEGEAAGGFDDIDRLTAFADNALPHILRLEGVLHYASDLARAIDAGQPLPAGSEEEIELRACAVHAVELLVDRIGRMGHSIYPALIDYLLWTRPRDARFRSLPRHRTLTTAY